MLASNLLVNPVTIALNFNGSVCSLGGQKTYPKNDETSCFRRREGTERPVSDKNGEIEVFGVFELQKRYCRSMPSVAHPGA